MVQGTLLRIEDLSAFASSTPLLKDISFSLSSGETLCIIGESGAGKSSLLKALLGIQQASWQNFQHQLEKSECVLTSSSSRRLGLPFTQWLAQDPLAALNPRLNLYDLVSETLFQYKLSKSEMIDKVVNALKSVELPADWMKRKPTELSIGQAQRVCIARAIICEPKLVLFDEPLNALDAITQKQVAQTMFNIHQDTQYAQIIVTHDLGFAKTYADKILVLKDGETDAYASGFDFFSSAQSTYCQRFLAAAQKLGAIE